MFIRSITAAAIIAASSIAATTAKAQLIRDSFTYQGSLSDNGAPANGLYDITFLVYSTETGGTPIASGSVTVNSVEVIDGLFSTEVDFGVAGLVFNTTTTRWIELRVSETGQPGTTILEPRQKLTPATLANYALRSEYAQHSGTSLQNAYANGESIDVSSGSGVATIFNSLGQSARLKLGSVTTPGNGSGFIEVFNDDAKLNAAMGSSLGRGRFRVFDSLGNPAAYMESNNLGGGRIHVFRNDSEGIGFTVDGNHAGTENTRVDIFGQQSMSFDTSAVADMSVILPNSAINSTELLNEAGLATNSNTTAIATLTPGFANIDTIESVTIQAPTDGYILLFATTSIRMDHFAGDSTEVTLSLSTSASAFSSFLCQLRIDELNSDGFYAYPVSMHGVFPVTEGSNTFYFLGNLGSNAPAAAWAADRQITSVFIPTAYGSVARDTAVQLGYPAVTPSKSQLDIIAEQNASLKANNERQQRELDEMKAIVDQIKHEMQREQQLQSRD
ncbi:MAG: hypothetical protein RLN78_08980 [Phycisphaerales bacterium]